MKRYCKYCRWNSSAFLMKLDCEVGKNPFNGRPLHVLSRFSPFNKDGKCKYYTRKWWAFWAAPSAFDPKGEDDET